MKTVLAAAALLTLTACASTALPPTPYAAGQTTFVGWVRFTEGEFQLYADEDQVLQPFSRPCVSGAGSLNIMRQAVQDLGGQKVEITGRTAPWSADQPGNRIENQGSVIRNACGEDFVILADAIRPI